MNPARGALLAANAKALFYAFAAEPVQTGRRVALDEVSVPTRMRADFGRGGGRTRTGSPQVHAKGRDRLDTSAQH